MLNFTLLHNTSEPALTFYSSNSTSPSLWILALGSKSGVKHCASLLGNAASTIPVISGASSAVCSVCEHTKERCAGEAKDPAIVIVNALTRRLHLQGCQMVAALQSSLLESKGLFRNCKVKAACAINKIQNMWRGGSEGIKGLE